VESKCDRSPEGEQTPSPSPGTPPESRTSSASGSRRLSRRGLSYALGVGVAIVVLVVAAWGLMGGFRANASSSTVVLVPAGTSYTLPAGQLNIVSIVLGSTGTINGTLAESFGLAIYLMTPAQLAAFVKTLKISGYEWTSGVLANNSIYGLSLIVQPGSWDIVFVNPNTDQFIPTSYGFYTDLTLTKT